MQIRWLGWAGVELRADGATAVIDPLADAGSMWAALPGGGEVPHPPVHAASPGARRTDPFGEPAAATQNFAGLSGGDLAVDVLDESLVLTRRREAVDRLPS